MFKYSFQVKAYNWLVKMAKKQTGAAMLDKIIGVLVVGGVGVLIFLNFLPSVFTSAAAAETAAGSSIGADVIPFIPVILIVAALMIVVGAVKRGR